MARKDVSHEMVTLKRRGRSMELSSQARDMKSRRKVAM